MVKTLAALAEDSGSVPSTHIAKQLTTAYITPVPGDLMPLLNSTVTRLAGRHVYIHVAKTFAYIK